MLFRYNLYVSIYNIYFLILVSESDYLILQLHPPLKAGSTGQIDMIYMVIQLQKTKTFNPRHEDDDNGEEQSR